MSFKVTIQANGTLNIDFDSIIQSGLSPQYGACATYKNTPICLGGVVAGKLTNGALVRKNNKWDQDSKYDLPLPMMHHSVIATQGTNPKMYVYGGQLPSTDGTDDFPTFPMILRKYLLWALGNANSNPRIFGQYR